MRFLLLLIILAAGAGAQAQSGYLNTFSNLTPGNRWEYAVTDHLVTPAVVTERRVTTVEAEIMVGPDRYSVVTSQGFGPDGAPTTDRLTCAYNSATKQVAPPGSTTLPNYSCASAFALPPYYRGDERSFETPSTVLISGQPITVDSLFIRVDRWVGTSGQGGSFKQTFARGLGLTYTRLLDTSRMGTTYTYTNRATDLVYARIEGTEYGRAVVAGEEAPLSEQAFALTASPNPSAGAFRIGASGATGRVDVDVFDTLGRRVDGGTAGASAPFTFRPEAPGVYVVRARDEAGHTAVRRVVRR